LKKESPAFALMKGGRNELLSVPRICTYLWSRWLVSPPINDNGPSSKMILVKCLLIYPR
jgi:hypothetical protein